MVTGWNGCTRKLTSSDAGPRVMYEEPLLNVCPTPATNTSNSRGFSLMRASAEPKSNMRSTVSACSPSSRFSTTNCTVAAVSSSTACNAASWSTLRATTTTLVNREATSRRIVACAGNAPKTATRECTSASDVRMLTKCPRGARGKSLASPCPGFGVFEPKSAAKKRDFLFVFRAKIPCRGGLSRWTRGWNNVNGANSVINSLRLTNRATPVPRSVR
mmetsp:Transcript_43822/g.98554  ORF Transcript_43822/g.98554 Transcript_43822/m.98554 type:complete len:217 (+) Transcript_43822:1014-1664(+)